MTAVLDTALAFHSADCSVVRVAADGTKRPLGAWKPYQQHRPDAAQLREWFSNGHPGIGIITGAVSGQMEMLELEGRAVAAGMWEELTVALADHGLADLWARITTGYLDQSPTAGLHTLYRVNGKARRNTKLASRPATAAELAATPGMRVVVLIETRGEGGMTVVAPSNGTTHPTGKPWTLICGGPDTIATITEDERDALYAVASLLDKMPLTDPVQFRQPGSTGHNTAGQQRPGDILAARTTWEEILTPAGWTLVRRIGTVCYWRRPGKTHGISATTRDDAGMYVFTTSTDLDTERPLTKFHVWSVLNGHGTDYPAAARALARLGYAPEDGNTGGENAILPSSASAAASPQVTPKMAHPQNLLPSSARRLVLTRASGIAPAPVIWAWLDTGQGRIPAGSLGLAAGREGTGKSSFLIWLTAMITRGRLPGAFAGTPRDVIYAAVEDSWRHTLVPRLIAAGADLDRVYRAEVQTAGDLAVTLNLPADNSQLEDAITDNAAAMVVFDPLMSMISGSLDTHKEREVRQALDPLAAMATRTGAILAGIAHYSKAKDADAAELITGSGAFKNVARWLFAFAADPDDATKGVISQVKNSLGRRDLPSLTYTISEATVPTAEGDAKTARIDFTGTSDRTVEDMLASSRDHRRDKAQAAQAFLLRMVASGPVAAATATSNAEAAGYTADQIRRARERAGVLTRKAGMTGAWYWCLPQHEGDLATLTEDGSPAAGQTEDGKIPEDGISSLPGAIFGVTCENTGPDARRWQDGISPREQPSSAALWTSCAVLDPLTALPCGRPKPARDVDCGQHADPPSPGRCAVCGDPMTVVLVGQTTHPNCDPEVTG